MTAALPESRGTGGVSSLEVRWIFPGDVADAVAGWFARFPAETTVLEDAYLLDPHLPGLSVKVRESRALEVKAYRGSPGLLEVAGRARVPTMCCAAKSMLPPRSCSPWPRPAGWNWVWVTPGPIRRGCAGSHRYCGARNLKAIRWRTFERPPPLFAKG